MSWIGLVIEHVEIFRYLVIYKFIVLIIIQYWKTMLTIFVVLYRHPLRIILSCNWRLFTLESNHYIAERLDENRDIQKNYKRKHDKDSRRSYQKLDKNNRRKPGDRKHPSDSKRRQNYHDRDTKKVHWLIIISRF